MIATLMGASGSTPRGTTVTQVRRDGVVGEWVCGPGVDRWSSQAIYYLHGSAYMMCSPATHRSLVARLSQATGLPCFVLDYRLAPEHEFPAAAADVDAGWRMLVAEGRRPSDIVVAGDSAGGHLAAAFELNRAAAGDPGPAGVVVLSPVIDVTFGLAAMQESRRRDPMITAARARRLLELYTANADLADPRLSLDYRAASDAAPFLIQAGGAEMLSADARHLADRLIDNGGTAELEVWPGQMHVFQALPRVTPEADAALLRIRDFVAAALSNRTRRTEGAA